MSDDLMSAFIEDSKDHLESIESDIMALENLKGAFDEELVNRIFRTAHSIKGAAGFFGLEAIGRLAHRLENALHLVRDQKVRPDQQTCQVLLEGFDQLSTMINEPVAGECMDITSTLETIQGLLTPTSKIETETSLQLCSNHGHSIFDVDMFTLDQGLKGGKFLYHIEFDLIHDIHRKDKTPYDIIKALQDTGLILDCHVDIGATGTLESGFAQRIPLNVLFASIIDPEVIGALVDVPAESIRRLERSMFQFHSCNEPTASFPVDKDAVSKENSPWRVINDQAILSLDEHFGLTQAQSFCRLLLHPPDDVAHLRIDLSGTQSIDIAGLQALVAALRTCAGQMRSMRIVSTEHLREQFQNLGFAWLLGDAI
ncbi:STAS domain-containing protein [Desulfonatronum thioautotrophicum]|uniref:STAS domain-containing protein n=1 Tax=Desulfonatronum thioautotrophicum TaxID=617001 RepID=UPI0005EB68DC|nr:STAS domain-containing protein [Desulfonatronum thioautotrophicum]